MHCRLQFVPLAGAVRHCQLFDTPESTEFVSVWKEILEITVWKVRSFVLDRRH